MFELYSQMILIDSKYLITYNKISTIGNISNQEPMSHLLTAQISACDNHCVLFGPTEGLPPARRRVSRVFGWGFLDLLCRRRDGDALKLEVKLAGRSDVQKVGMIVGIQY